MAARWRCAGPVAGGAGARCHGNLRALRLPATVWLLHVGTLWFWHAAVPYDAALDNQLVHVAEHVSFLVTAVLFWRVVIGARSAGRVSNGSGVLLVFLMAMQSVFLSVLLTFARTPWYAGYERTTRPWGVDARRPAAGRGHHVDPGRRDLPAVALALFVAWVRATEDHDGAADLGGRTGQLAAPD